MRLAFERALARSGYDSSALEAANPEQIEATWTGPRDK